MYKAIRASVILTAIVLLFAAEGNAQFPIKLPEIPKIRIEKRQSGGDSGNTTSSPSSPSSTSPSSNSSSSRASGLEGGVPVPGARMYFSTTPFTDSSAGAKSTFTSQEFIYGRLELDRSISDAFGLGNMQNRDYYYIKYSVVVGDNESWQSHPNGGTFLYLTKDDVKKNFLNFDVLPDPNNVSTSFAGIDELWNYGSAAYLVGKYDAQSKFPKNGDYRIRIVLYQNLFDDYGKPRFDSAPLPYAAGQFTFQFAARDFQALIANSEKATANLGAAKNKREMLKALPAWWGKAKAPADAKLSAARLTPLLNDYANRWGRAYLGKFVWDNDSLPIWRIQKDELGLPKYRYATSIWAIYKDNKDGMCYLGSHSIREDYSGGGTYGQMYLNTMGDRTYIDCAVVR